MRHLLATAGLALLAAGELRADDRFAPASLVRDLATADRSLSSLPTAFQAVGPYVFFFAADTLTGRELWRTDGSAEGTLRLADMTPGEESSDDTIAAVIAGDVISGANRGLWRSDGTIAGTAPVGEGPPYRPHFAADVDGVSYYFDDDREHGTELWRSDGTAAGTFQVADLNPDGSIAPQTPPVAAGGRIYLLVVPNPLRGHLELWTTDGTAAGSRRVRDVTTTSRVDNPPAEMVPLGDWVIFTTTFGTVWRSNGTAGGTFELNLSVRSPRALTPIGDRVVFVATDDTSGEELWITDGTRAGTRRIVDLEPGPVGSRPGLLRAVDDEVFFRANRSDVGSEIWRTDGTRMGTHLARDLVPQAGGSVCVAGFGEALSIDGGYFFLAERPQEPCGLWRLDAATGDTIRLATVAADTSPFTPQLAALGSYVVFAGSDGQEAEPWITDGTAEGTRLLRDARTETTASSPYAFTGTAFGSLFVAAADGTTRSVWHTDGTAAGTVSLDALEPGALRQLTSDPKSLGNLGVFTATDETGHWLWSTAGTPASTVRLRRLRSSNGRIDFSVIDAAAYFEVDGDLWLTDGTTRGTRLVKSGVYAQLGGPPAELDGALYFGAFGLVRTDGTADGTYPLTEGMPHGGRLEVVVAGQRVYFPGNENGYDEELWQSDGTSAGTARVVDIHPGVGDLDVPYSSRPHHLTAIGDRLLFFADDGTHGSELWLSDGSAGGTHLVRDIRPGPESSLLRGARVPATATLRTVALFAADSNGAGSALWRSDGTAEGTFALTSAIGPDRLTTVGPLALFLADGELWRTDGTPEGTYPVLTFTPYEYVRILSEDAGPLAIGRGTLFFTLDHPIYGTEPWAASVAALLCWGDVGGDRSVTINELIAGVGAALGDDAHIRRAFDADDDGRVEVAELVAAVRNATDGCTR